MTTTVQTVLKQCCIALTGGIATGKSTVASILEDLGFTVIDADALSREVTREGSPTLATLVATFGREIVQTGSLDRRRLRQIAFADPDARRRLEAIMHPAIRNALFERLKRLGMTEQPRWLFYEASLVFESGTAPDFFAVWVTDCSEATQRARLVARTGFDPSLADQVLDSQSPLADKRAGADYVIDTEGSLGELKERVHRAVRTLPQSVPEPPLTFTR